MGRKTKIGIVIFAGLILRLLLVPLSLNINDDLLVHEEWGRVFQITGADYFYFFDGWIYSFPTQPPLTSWMFSFAYRLYSNHPLLAELHNQYGLPPGFVVKFFYDYGYYLLLKLPAIIADLGLGMTIYFVIQKIVPQKAFLALVFYIFNPLTIFLSGLWGQTESLIALFGMLAFISLANRKVAAALPLYFISLYFKPTWGVFIPLFLFLLLLIKPKIIHLIYGAALSLIIFLVATTPFSNGNLIEFTRDIIIENMLPIAKGTSRASVSAFNFHSIFFDIDSHLADRGVGPITPSLFGYISFIVINIITFRWLMKRGINVKHVITAVFVIGASSFMLLANMLERYIFIAFPALVILMFIDKKIVFWGLLMNLVIFINMGWAFYRRSNDELTSFFALHGGAAVRVLSAINLLSWFQITRRSAKI